MNEEFLSFIWQNKLYNPHLLQVEGCKTHVIHPGERNYDSGPDFFNAKIQIGDTFWAGNVEIHTRASDWNRHGHDTNPAFDNVILHATSQNDQSVFTSKGRKVTTVEIKYNKAYEKHYRELMVAAQWVACAEFAGSLDPVLVSSVLGRLGIERLEDHTCKISNNLEMTVNDWEEALYRQLARSFGFHVNSQPFEMLAKSLSYKIIKKYSSNLLQLEALLFGQAGFLQNDYSSDDYYRLLKKEYTFLQAKHNLKQIDNHTWKFMRLRPNNFPTLRIAQFAALLHKNPSLLSDILETKSVDGLCDKLAAEVSEYWSNHFVFEQPSVEGSKQLGRKSAEIIVINTIVPFYFTYGRMLGANQFKDLALHLLEKIEPENNSIITNWIKLGIRPRDAFESQALLQLKNSYCDKRRCLTCGLGVKIISRAEL